MVSCKTDVYSAYLPTYGSAKQVYQVVLPGSSAALRSGYIVEPEDAQQPFSYQPSSKRGDAIPAASFKPARGRLSKGRITRQDESLRNSSSKN